MDLNGKTRPFYLLWDPFGPKPMVHDHRPQGFILRGGGHQASEVPGGCLGDISHGQELGGDLEKELLFSLRAVQIMLCER